MIRRDCTTHPTSDNSLVRVSGWWPRLDWSILSVLEWCAMSNPTGVGMDLDDKEDLEDFLSTDAPIWAVRSFLELLGRGDIRLAKRLLTFSLQNATMRREADLVSEMAFLAESGWRASACRARNGDGT